MTIQKTPTVTAHCDAHLDNFMYCEATGELTMIDFELMHPFPVAFDFAYHFIFYEPKHTSLDQIHPREKQAILLKEYFNEMGHAGNNQKQLIEDYLDSIEIMVPVVILHCIILVIMLAETPRELNV